MEFVVKIEKLSNLGFGIARIDSQVVFVEGACPGDEVKIEITQKHRNFSHARITEIITPSVHRVKPVCAMQKVCGACRLQFIDYNYQLELKRQIVQDAMRTIGNLDIEIPAPVPSPQIFGYRRKIQYPVSETKVSKRLLAGYYKPQSHEIVNIKHCPIQPAICDDIIDFIRNKAPDFGISGYNERKHSGDLRHIVIRSSASEGANLVTLAVNATKPFQRLKDFARAVFDEFREVSGVCVNFNSKKTNVIMGAKTECLAGKNFVEEKILGKTFKIGANTFFQVNPESAENIFAYVRDYIRQNFNAPVVLDAYAGISSFGICVSDVCKKVVSVEENADSCDFARAAAPDNPEIHNMDVSEFFAKEKRKFDVIIVDPPRKGCTQQSLDEACRLLKPKGRIIYVSCNPATLARDLKYLTGKGAKVESIQPFDMFCHTYHIENAAVISVH
ncbi:MAG: 23S rRNA (uracil(1939)-C(5))-methyltransferase RlmD [Heliobacteriaceae bacterium]|jgi:23S rRNA (uracil1939-C5)-methyltransferase|nr:23S rRNA (uracil(1939)-C(5))-methyltransferase RlmD [Heliobacteriaceae bacterium]